MSEQRRLHPNDGDFYIMELGQSLFVDAKEKGNLMRLINHRCGKRMAVCCGRSCMDVDIWGVARPFRYTEI